MAAELAAEVMASKEWYFRPKGWKSGKTEPDPVTINGLRALLEKGTITEFTPMRGCGMTIWRPMRRVPQLVSECCCCFTASRSFKSFLQIPSNSPWTEMKCFLSFRNGNC